VRKYWVKLNQSSLILAIFFGAIRAHADCRTTLSNWATEILGGTPEAALILPNGDKIGITKTDKDVKFHVKEKGMRDVSIEVTAQDLKRLKNIICNSKGSVRRNAQKLAAKLKKKEELRRTLSHSLVSLCNRNTYAAAGLILSSTFAAYVVRPLFPSTKQALNHISNIEWSLAIAALTNRCLIGMPFFSSSGASTATVGVAGFAANWIAEFKIDNLGGLRDVDIADFKAGVAATMFYMGFSTFENNMRLDPISLLCKK